MSPGYEKQGDRSRKEKTDLFFAGYEAVKQAAEPYGITVLPSAELQLDGSPNHYLLYGFERSFFLREDLFTLTPAALHAYAAANGVLLVQAHPFRDGKNIPVPDCVDGVEAYNSNPRHENFTKKTLALAKAHGLLITAGSDSHRSEDVARTGILTPKRIETAADYISALRTGAYRVISHWTEEK